MTLTLSQLIAKVESNNNSHLVRYEPDWKYVTEISINKFHLANRPGKMSNLTAKMLMSCSWGKYQMMGSNLYDMGFDGKIVDFATDIKLQDQYFQTFIERKGINYTLDQVITDESSRKNFAKKYNGDAVVYAARMLEIFNQMKV